MIILEDVERSNISIFEILGYVNSLVEQDGAKVMLVTNEDEIYRYDYVEKSEKEKSESDDIVGHKKNGNILVRNYTKETIRYFQTKEKSIGDTILFKGNTESAIKVIIHSFNNEILHQFATDQHVANIAAMMFILGSENLRSVIFACQKTVDIFECIQEDSYSNEFLTAIFYGIITFSMRMHADSKYKWIGLENYSEELGFPSYPLFRFCFDYITTQRLDTSLIPAAYNAFNKLRLYDPNKTSSDPDLKILTHFHIHTEGEVINAIENITRRLNNPGDISFHDYGRIASALVTAKYELGIDISVAKTMLVNNLKGRGNSIQGNDLFLHTISTSSIEEQQEFVRLREDMIQALEVGKGNIPDFDYLPEQALQVYEYVRQKTGEIYEAHGFAKFFDIPRFIKMYFDCTAEQMNHIRCAFIHLYKSDNVKKYLSSDLSAIVDILTALETGQEHARIDKVQQLQCRWLISKLTEIKSKLT